MAQSKTQKTESSRGHDPKPSQKPATKGRQSIDDILSQKLSKNQQSLDQKNAAKQADEKKEVSHNQPKAKAKAV